MAKAEKSVTPQQAQLKLLGQGLGRFTVPELREVASHFGWKLKGLRRDDILAQMGEFYLSDPMVEQALATLSQDERNLLALCAWIGWSEPAHMLNALRALLDALPKRWVAHAPSAAHIDKWVTRGLLLRTPNGQVGVLDSFARRLLPIPELLGAPDHAARLRPRPPVDPLASLLISWDTVRAAGEIAPSSPFPSGVARYDGVQWPLKPVDQSAYWQAAAVVPIYPASSMLPSSLYQRLIGRLEPQESGKAAFFAALLDTLGLLDKRATTFYTRDEALQKFLAQPLEAQWKRLIDGWQAMGYGLWDEYSWVQQTHPELRLYRRPTMWQLQPAIFVKQLTAMRVALFNILRWLPTERGKDAGWVAVRSLARLLWATNPFVIAPPLRTGGWFLGDSLQRPFDPEKWDAWQRSSQHVLGYVLEGPLRWLGLIDTAQDKAGQLLALRLTPIGAAVLQGAPLPKPKMVAPTWQPSLGVSVQPGAATFPLVGLLARVAASEGMTGGALRFRFTREAAHAAFEAGTLLPDLRAAFARLGAALPDEVSQALERWWERWGLLHQYDELALIELADELLVREVLTATALGQSVVFRCSPTALAIPASAVEQVIRDLEKKGYLPRVVGE